MFCRALVVVFGGYSCRSLPPNPPTAITINPHHPTTNNQPLNTNAHESLPMNSSLLFLLCFLVAGLVVLLARENRLRRALQALCGRLASRVAALTEKAQSQSFSALTEHPARPFNTTSNFHPSTSASSPPANNHDPIQHQQAQQHEQHQTSTTRHRPFRDLRPLSQRPYRLSRFFKRRRQKHRRSHSRQHHQHHHQQQYQEKHQRRN